MHNKNSKLQKPFRNTGNAETSVLEQQKKKERKPKMK